MNPLKRLIRKLPGGKGLTDRLSYRRRKRILERIGDVEDRFTDIYTRNKWKDTESRSGVGSSLQTTEAIRASLPELFEELSVSTILDAPCGDFYWFRHVQRHPGMRYIGGDIVKPLIEENTRAYADEKTQFLHLDIIRDTLPHADLWLCRDCLVHLSYADVDRVLENFSRSDIDYLLVTTHVDIEANIDIPTGHYREINLEIEPFNFDPPIRYLEDDDHAATGKRLGLWERGALAVALNR